MTASRAAFVYGALVCLLYALVPSLTFPTPPLDVVEGFAWGRELQLGYTKHPPMQAWLLEMSYRLTGGGVFGGYVLSAASIALGYLFVWRLARRLGLGPWPSFWALVLTSVTFYFTLPLPEFNPNVLQVPVWAGMMLLFHRAVAQDRLLDWVLLGALAAFGLYTKYFVLLLIGSIGLYTLVFADARRRLAGPGPWACALTCVVLLVPHLLWLAETDLLTLRYAASRSKPALGLLDHLVNPLNFLAAQVGNHAGLFLVALAGLGWGGLASLRARRAASLAPLPGHGDRFLLWFAFLPLAVVLLASAITGNEFEHMWGTPMFVLSGIVAVRFLALPDLWSAPRRALAAAVTIQALFLGILLGQALVEPYWKVKQTRIHYPAREVAERLAGIWREATGSDLAYVAGDMWTAANVTLFAPGRPSMYYLHDPELSPWIDQADVQKHGVMLVWRGDSDQPVEQIRALYPDARSEGSFEAAYLCPGDMPPARVHWIIVPPGDVVEVGGGLETPTQD